MDTARRFDFMRWLQDVDERLNGAVAVGARERLSPIEDWHEVGSGYPEPVFNPRWEQYGNDFAPVGFYRDTSGVVHFRGAARLMSEPAPGRGQGTIFRLPVGYRPEEQLAFHVPVLLGEASKRPLDWGTVTIHQAAVGAFDAPGDVEATANVGADHVYFLDGIHFLSDRSVFQRYNPDLGVPPTGF